VPMAPNANLAVGVREIGGVATTRAECGYPGNRATSFPNIIAEMSFEIKGSLTDTKCNA
jgi:hypothetical protein